MKQNCDKQNVFIQDKRNVIPFYYLHCCGKKTSLLCDILSITYGISMIIVLFRFRLRQYELFVIENMNALLVLLPLKYILQGKSWIYYSLELFRFRDGQLLIE